MAQRGRKPRTARNSSDRHSGLIRRESLEPPSVLGDAAKAEYWRLVGVLDEKGTLDRVDLAVVAEAARIKAILDRAYADVELVLDRDALKTIGAMTTHRRGLLRELGLTLHPSRSIVRTNPSKSEAAEDDPVAAMIKLSG